jgi:hypothetical protein
MRRLALRPSHKIDGSLFTRSMLCRVYACGACVRSFTPPSPQPCTVDMPVYVRWHTQLDEFRWFGFVVQVLHRCDSTRKRVLPTTATAIRIPKEGADDQRRRAPARTHQASRHSHRMPCRSRHSQFSAAMIAHDHHERCDSATSCNAQNVRSCRKA